MAAAMMKPTSMNVLAPPKGNDSGVTSSPKTRTSKIATTIPLILKALGIGPLPARTSATTAKLPSIVGLFPLSAAGSASHGGRGEMAALGSRAMPNLRFATPR